MANNEIAPALEESSASSTTTDQKHAEAVVVSEETYNSPTKKSKAALWRRVVGLVWDSVEGDKRHQRYVKKLDTFLL